MKKFLITISLVFSSIVLTGCGSMMIEESRSPYDFDKTVDTIVDNSKAHGWSIPQVYDFRKILLSKGTKDIGKVKIIKLCSAGLAESMLGSDETKYMGAMMPCSISVFEKGDGHTYISSMNMELMSHLFGGEAGDTLKSVSDTHEKILAFLE